MSLIEQIHEIKLRICLRRLDSNHEQLFTIICYVDQNKKNTSQHSIANYATSTSKTYSGLEILKQLKTSDASAFYTTTVFLICLSTRKICLLQILQYTYVLIAKALYMFIVPTFSTTDINS